MKNTIPFVTDLDHTLIQTDCFQEALITFAKNRPFELWKLFFWMFQGKARLKFNVFSQVNIDINHFPIQKETLHLCKQAHAEGKPVIVATATLQTTANVLKERFPWISEVIGSTETINLTGQKKADALIARFGSKGYDFISDHKRDFEAWEHCNQGYFIGTKKPSWLKKISSPIEYISIKRNSVDRILKMMRPTQWVKNGLIFVPALMNHQFFDLELWQLLGLSALAFCATASFVYILNDLLDMSSDRLHHSKRLRPLAAGEISIPLGLSLAFGLLFVALGLGISVSERLLIAILGYIGLNTLYSFYLKKIPIIDVFVLSSFYIIRLLMGGWIGQVALSNWLLAFSFFLFLSLGILKRYSELTILAKDGKLSAKGRGYHIDDQMVLFTLGSVSGITTAVILGLYIDQTRFLNLYTHPSWLWGIVALLMFWMMHVWFQAHRGRIKDDPVKLVFTDPTTLIIGLLSALLFVAAL